MNPTTHAPDLLVPGHEPLPPPLLRILRLLRMVHRAAPEFAISLGLLLGWTRDEIEARNACAAQARAIDDPVQSLNAEIARALANDPAPLRRRIKAALACVHARSEALATRLELDASADLSAPAVPPAAPTP